MHSLKEGWAKIVRPEDYDLHMERVGQSPANAALLRDGLISVLDSPAKILFAGAGTGSLFEFADFRFLNEHEVTFADINPSFLARLDDRARAEGLTGFRLQECDLESFVWEESFNGIVLVLVLEHVDERLVLSRLAERRPDWFFVVIQENPAEVTTNVSPHRVLPESLARAAEFEAPHLIPRADLVGLLADIGFGLADERTVDVPDAKKMVGLTFRRV